MRRSLLSASRFLFSVVALVTFSGAALAANPTASSVSTTCTGAGGPSPPIVLVHKYLSALQPGMFAYVGPTGTPSYNIEVTSDSQPSNASLHWLPVNGGSNLAVAFQGPIDTLVTGARVNCLSGNSATIVFNVTTIDATYAP